MIVGAPFAASVGNGRAEAGESYVIFGAASLPTTINLSTITTAGLVLYGIDASDRGGRVSTAGDVNGDGFADVIVGAPGGQASGNAKSGAGESYIVFGSNSFTNSILPANLGTNAANTINGTSAANIINGADGNDILVGLGGADVLNGGRGDDILAVSDTGFRRIIGGNGQDRLRLDGAGLTLELNARSDNRILGIEAIDLTGTGDNTLILNRNDVLNISDESNALLVRGNAGDRVGIDTGWSQAANEVIGGDTFQVFQNGLATLRVLQGVAVRTAIVNLGTSVGSGTTVFGATAGGASGVSVSDVGDVNGDGFDDVIIGAPYAFSTGRSYLIFGGPNQPPTIDLTSVGSAGLAIPGLDIGDSSGQSVSAAGDINADGFGDILIGAPSANGLNNTEGVSGEVYVLFGAAGGVLGSMTIYGADNFDRAGISVSSAGDVNADGYDDLIIGANGGDGAGAARTDSGEAYIVFGGNTLPPVIDLGLLGTAGVTIYGRESVDQAGSSVSSAGDVNGDGFDDVLIGAFDADGVNNLKPNSGESYVVFGGATLSTTIDLASLGTQGFRILGANSGDVSGYSVSGAGDVNGDGLDDLIIGARGGASLNNARGAAGESYVVFGRTSTTDIDLSTLGTSGVIIWGAEAGDISGRAVSGAGDVNGDGFDDLLIGAYSAASVGNARIDAGEAYIVFGGPSLSTSIDLATLGTAGVTLFGRDANDRTGRSGVSTAGDVNGDGFDDVIVGARNADAAGNAKVDAGESYIVLGGNAFLFSVTHHGTPNSETLVGSAAADVMIGGRGDDTLLGSGGADVLIGGQGNDILSISDLTFKRIVGGNGTDTLRIAGTGMSLNLTSIRDNRIAGIEVIDIIGTGNNTLTLNPREVLNLSDTSNTLVVRRDTGDVVNIGSGWTRIPNEVVAGVTFEVFVRGLATVKVQVVPIIVDSPNPNYVESGVWVNSSITGFNGTRTRFANTANAIATWNAPNLSPGYYSVAFWKIPVAGNSTNAQVSIVHNGITEPNQTINLATGPAGFTTLGTFFFSGAPGEFVRLSQGAVVGNLRVDAVSFTRLSVNNAAPTIDAPTAQAVDGNGVRVFSTAGGNAIAVADVDAGVASVQLSLTATNGLITLPSTAGLTFTAGTNGQASMTFRGTLPNLNAALNGMSYQPNLNFSGAATLRLVANDRGNTGVDGIKSATRTIALTVSSPVFVVDNSTAGYVEVGAWMNSSLTGINGSTTRFSNAANATATWNAPSLTPGFYSVEIWRVTSSTSSSNAQVSIVHNGITEPNQTVNLASGAAGFVGLGTFFFSGAPGESISLSQGTTLGNLRADAVRFTKLP